MIISDDFARRRRVAWGVLLTSFTVFLIICVSVPLGLTTYLRSSVQPLITSISANQGTVAVTEANGERSALLAAEAPRTIDTGAEIITNAADSALILAYSPSSAQLLLRGQLYSNTQLTIEEASSPRFQFNSLPHTLAITQNKGRLRFTIVDTEQTTVSVFTPHGQIEIRQAGQYAIDVRDSETQIAVQSGEAKLITTAVEAENLAQSLMLSSDQRGVLVPSEKPQGPLNTERNLIQNGDFTADFSTWIVQDWNVERANQPNGETRTEDNNGQDQLVFDRVGIGHADAGLRQVLNQNVTDFESLRLLLSFRIAEQTLGVCGTVGSECPLSVRLEYQDETGATRTWEQGFYAIGTVAPDTPDICINCSPPYNPHQEVPMGRLQAIDIDLLQSLARQGFSPPTQIKSISITAAGHTFTTEIVEIALLGKE